MFKVYCGESENNLQLGTNEVRTTRYNMLTAIPLYLWDVFNPKTKLANVFFLIVSILQCIPSVSLTNGLPTSLPSLITIIGAEAVHISILESKRRKSDGETNSRIVLVWNSLRNEWEEKHWSEVHVRSFASLHDAGRRYSEDPQERGHPLRHASPLLLRHDAAKPVLHRHHQHRRRNGRQNKDGSVLDLSSLVRLYRCLHRRIPSFLDEQPVLLCEAENPNTSSFDGILRFAASGSVEQVSISSVLLRGCRIVFTDWVVGCAVSVGNGTKIEYSTQKRPPKKESDSLLLLNRCVFYLLVLLIVICLVSAVLSVLWDRSPHANIIISISSLFLHFIKSFFVFFQLCYQIVPASLYVCVEIA